jgi:ABC-type uncharacterized transport system involved in gliding motility auxiliary subunit
VNRKVTSGATLLVLLVLFFGVNILAGTMLRSMRVDLTEQNLYTLSDGSRAIARGVDEPIRLYLYFSRSLAEGQAALQSYGRRVRELLEEYVRASGGAIVLETIDPEPFSEAEDEAVRAGLAALPMSGTDSFYFGLLGTNSTDGREVIPFFDPGQEQFLEYELSRLIHTLANPRRNLVGVLSALPLDGAQGNPMLGQQPQPPWQIMRDLRGLFEVSVLQPTVTEIPEDIKVLLVVHPKALPVEAEYAIDQYLLGGGRAVILVDPFCETDLPPAAMRQNPAQMFSYQRSSTLPGLFAAWGIEFDATKVAADLDNAQTVRYQSGNRQEEGSYVAWLGLGAESVDSDDAVTGRLTSINIATGGSLRAGADAPVTLTPLLKSSSNSMEVDATRFAFVPDIRGLLNDFAGGGEPLVLAARISGDVPSAFPAGPPGTPEGEAPPEGHLAASTAPINVVVVADVDMIADRLWMREQRLGPILLGYSKLADNGDLVVNAMENLGGSSDLIGIRASGRFTRPFDLVDRLRREAEQEFLAEEQQLQQQLRDTEAKINEIQRGRADANELILTPDQVAEIEAFKQQRVETRKALRNVRLNLRKDIEKLGARIKMINIGLVPLLVALAAVGLGLYRTARRKSDRRAVAQT